MLRKISTPGFAALDTPSVFCYGVAMPIKPNLNANIPTQGSVRAVVKKQLTFTIIRGEKE